MWKKWLLRILLGFIVLLLFIVGFIVLKKDKLINTAIVGLNQQLDAKVEVSGAIDITFLSTFPSLTLELQKVFIADKFNANDTLASLDQVNFTINPFSLFGETISFKSISLSDGMIKLKTYKDGRSNYEILRVKKQQTDSSNTVALDLNEILLHNIALVYDDEKNKIFADALIVGAAVSGAFKDKDFELFIDLKTDADVLSIGNTQFLNQNLVSATFDLFYESENKCISFKENSISINENLFNIQGSVCSETNTIDLIAKAKGKKLKNALQLIPKDLFNLEGINGNGVYEVEVLISEQLNKPKIFVNFSLEDAKANIEGVNLDFEKLYAYGSFSNFPKNNIIVKDFSFTTGQSAINGNLFLPNLSQKEMQVKANGSIFTSELEALNLPNISFENDGKIEFVDLDLDFRYRQQDSIWIASKLTGNIDFDGIKGAFTEINQNFSLSGDINAVDRKMTVEQLDFTLGENDIRFSGNIFNALNYLQEDVFKTNDELIVNGTLSSNRFDINSFLEGKENSKSENEKIPDLLKWLNISSSLKLEIEELIYNKLVLNNLSAKIQSEKAGIFYLNNISANGLDGSANGTVELRFFTDKTLEVSINSKLKDIDINKLFLAFDNFDQQTITNNNIKGKLSADLMVAMKFKNFVDFQQEDLLVNSNFVIEDGELISFQALNSLSKYLSVEQLEHIYFSKYKSQISIVDKVLYLEKSQIKSNLISLELGGSHSFNNDIDYIVKLNLNNLLAAKFKKKKTLQEDYVNDIMGGINLFISMKGNIDDPIIKLEKRSAFNDIEKENKGTFKEEVKEYFKKDDPNKKEEKEFYFEEDEEEFIDFDE